MRFPIVIAVSVVAVALATSSCNNEDKTEHETKNVSGIKEENITYTADNVTMHGFVAYDTANMDKRPVVLVVHEWWGLNDYSKSRAKQLAELGYIAMAIDMYGDGKTADNPTDAGKMATPFYQNPAMAKTRFDAAMAKIKTYSQADNDKVVAIGYCFGGSMILNMAKLGDDLKGVVSFHGGLAGVPADKSLLKSKILVCHGGADPFVPQADVDQFKKQLDSIGANYSFKVYSGATHSFTNPNATAMGEKFKLPIAYNPAADSASWNDMKEFFGTILK